MVQGVRRNTCDQSSTQSYVSEGQKMCLERKTSLEKPYESEYQPTKSVGISNNQSALFSVNTTYNKFHKVQNEKVSLSPNRGNLE